MEHLSSGEHARLGLSLLLDDAHGLEIGHMGARSGAGFSDAPRLLVSDWANGSVMDVALYGDAATARRFAEVAALWADLVAAHEGPAEVA